MRTEQSLQTTSVNEAEDKFKADLSQLQSETDNKKLFFSVKEVIYSDLALSLQKL